MVKARSFSRGIGWSRVEYCRARCWVERWEDGDRDEEGIHVRTNDGQCHGDRQNGEAPPKRGGGRKTENRQLGIEK